MRLVVVAAILLSAVAGVSASRDRAPVRLTLAEAVASLDARDLEGRRWHAAALAGRVVVLDFWATWCAPCLAEIPTLRRLAARHPRERFVVLGVNLDVSGRRALVSWLNRQRVDWPQIHDGRGYNGLLAERFGVTSLPTMVLIDARGRVVATNLRGPALESAVAQLLK